MLSSALITLGLFLTAFGPICGALFFWAPFGTVLSPAGTYTVITGISLIVIGWAQGGFSFSGFRVSLGGLSVALLLVLLSDWICRDYNLFQGPVMRGEILLFSLLCAAFLYTKNTLLFFKLATFFSCAYLFWGCINAAQGRTIFSDDHSVVMYRLQLLVKHFPYIPFYNPLWNAGIDARDFFATGILNLFTLASPLLYLFPIEEIYTVLLAALLFIVFPLLTWFATQIFSEDRKTPWIATLLTLSNNLFWYRWALKYGSMGFVTASLFITLNLGLFYLLWSPEKRISFAQGFLFIITATLMFFWSPTAIVFLPCFLIGLVGIKPIFKKSVSNYIVLGLFILNVPWMILFVSISNVNKFVSLSTAQPTHNQPTIQENSPSQDIHGAQKIKPTKNKLTPKSLLREIRNASSPLNPLILVFGFAGIFLIRDRRQRILFGAMTVWLLFLGLVVAPMKPQLEFDRMLIILGLVLCIPTATLISRLLNESFNSRWLFVVGSVIGGTLCTGIISVATVLFNRSIEKYSYSSSVYTDLARAIRESAGDGRVVFSGFVLHELDNGHLAPLMQKTEKPLVASSLYHNVWRYTDIMPHEFTAQGEHGVVSFLDLMNATVVVAHERKWRHFFMERRDQYEFLAHIGVFHLFKRKQFQPTYFQEGSGSIIDQTSSSLTVRVDTPNTVLKFNYFPFLRSNECTLSPASVSESLTFIRITNCPPGTVLRIEGKTGFARLVS